MSDNKPIQGSVPLAEEKSVSSDSKEQQGNVSFEQAMEKLEIIVDQLEGGDVPLEKAIELFQEGMELSKTCHQKLEQIEKKVHLLVEENGELVKKEFRAEAEEDPS